MSYIIFGAGSVGQKALDYYGNEQVYCFADNDKKKADTFVNNKRIICIEEFNSIAHNYTIIIAVTIYEEIVKQFNSMGLQNYFVFRTEFPMIEKELVTFSDSLDSIVLCGRDESTDGILEIVKRLGCDWDFFSTPQEISNSVAMLSDEFLQKCKRRKVIFLVAAYEYHFSIQAVLEQACDSLWILDPFAQKRFYDENIFFVDSYKENSSVKTEDEWNNSNESNTNIKRREIKNYVDVVRKKPVLFKYIEIETFNRCNGTCSFCPVNRNIDPRQEKKMEMSLFKKIIDELHEIDYSGHISLFSNNEPLLDDRIVEMNYYVRDMLPKASLYLFTNGIRLTIELLEQLLMYLDELIIDNYSVNLNMIKPVKEIYDYIADKPEMKKKVTIIIRDPQEVLTTRGGDAPNRNSIVSYAKETCALPFRQMIIRPDGKVSLCCNDPLGKETLGDLSKQGILEVWYGDRYNKIRDKIADGRGKLQHCIGCDTFYLY